uniref:Tr-type G domain-containing protein n=1 Tax=Anopheles maculatus TaxID=74869 RepID=A0A182T860_9DIPT
VGIGERLLERSGKKLQTTIHNVPIIVATPTPIEARPAGGDVASTVVITPNPSVAKKTLAFEVNSPRMQSPCVSGRNTPEITDEARQQHQQSLKATPKEPITLLDAPGHKDFIPNMISGANQADVALLVVDATRGEFETGFEQGGQTREHALLVRSLGVSQLGVVVNKLDTVGWSKERFDEIVGKLKVFLKQAGFRDADVTYVPCSGLTGENLVKDPSDLGLIQWYDGPTLLKVIDSFKTPERAIDKPFRLSVADIFKGTGSGFCLCGRIESGMVCVNDKVLVCPSKEQAVVKNITIDELPQQTAFAGDQVSLTLANIDINTISVGYILSDIYHPVPLATRILARIVVFNIKVPITRGYPVLLHHQSLIEPATIRKLKAQLHKGTGEVIKKNPRCLGNNSCALVEIEFQRPIGMERYADFKDLGRIMLRVEGVTIAAGLVTEIVK